MRRNGTLKFHRVKVWNDEHMFGAEERCPGTNGRQTVGCSWPTYQAAEAGLAALRETMKAPVSVAEETIADGEDMWERMERENDEATPKAEAPKILLPGVDY